MIYFYRQTLKYSYTVLQYFCNLSTQTTQHSSSPVFSSLSSRLSTKADNLLGLKSLPDDSSLTLEDKFNQKPACIFIIVVILMNCFLGGEVSDWEMFMWKGKAAIFQMDEGSFDKRVETGGESLNG